MTNFYAQPIYTYPADNGDGSVSVYVFSTKEAAVKFAEELEDNIGHGWAEDCIQTHSLVFDGTGKLVNGEDDG